MMILPSPSAMENEDSEYFDDYYLDLPLSSVEGKMHLCYYLFVVGTQQLIKEVQKKTVLQLSTLKLANSL